jgi:pimeloyl-ACP methyl ester carboxylesterase
MAIVATIGIIIVVLIAIGVVYQRTSLRRDAQRFPPAGRLVDIGDGRRLHIHTMGEGRPTVVLEAGVAASSLSWQLIQPQVAKFATVCSYDRAGLGWSDQTDVPRTPAAIARELRQLLTAAKLPAPYVIVGHSFGGLVAQQFAALFPDETPAIVLVDPLAPSDWHEPDARRRRMLWGGTHLSRRGAMLARVGIVRASVNAALNGGRITPKVAGLLASGRTGAGLMTRLAGEIQKLPRESWPMVASHWSNPKCFEGMARHLERLPESCAEVATMAPLTTPATVIIAEDVARAGRDPAPALPNASRIVALKSGHWVQLDSPELVVEAIRARIASLVN